MIDLFIFLNHGHQKAHSPKVLALATAEHADDEGDDDNAAEHCQGDYQRLEVHCSQTEGGSGFSGSSQRRLRWQASCWSAHVGVLEKMMSL